MQSDEIRKLQEEAKQLLDAAARLAERVEALEKQTDETQEAQTERLPAAKTPPPLPKSVKVPPSPESPISEPLPLKSEKANAEYDFALKVKPSAPSEESAAAVSGTSDDQMIGVAESARDKDRRTRATGPKPIPAFYSQPSPEAENFLTRYLRDYVNSMREKTRELGWEVSLGTYWIPRVAVVLIAIAVVLFLSLAIEKWGSRWMPHARVAGGYAVCAGLLALAWKIERRYPPFARVLYAGGFGLIYFVTYGTHFIKFSRVFGSPTPTLVLLAFIVVAWAAVAQIRRSRTIAFLVTILGHFTISLATAHLSVASPVSPLTIVFLAAGSAFFLLKNRWYHVAFLGIVGSYINFFFFLNKSAGAETVSNFVLAMSALTSYFLIFSLAELFAPRGLRRRKVPLWFRSSYVTLNSAAFLGLGSLVIHLFDFSKDHQDLFCFLFAVVLTLIALAYLQVRKRDPLYNAYLTKAVVVLTLGLSAKYDGNALSTWLALETVVLLISARRSGLVVSRILAFGIGCIALIHGLVSVNDALQIANGEVYQNENYFTGLCQAALTVLSFLAASILYQFTDWSIRSPRSAPFSKQVLKDLWHLELIAEWPGSPALLTKPLGRTVFPYLYALAAVVLLVPHVYLLTEEGHRFVTIAFLAAALAAISIPLLSKPFELLSLLLVAAAVIFGTWEITVEPSISDLATILGLVALAGVALGSEPKLFGDPESLSLHRDARSSYFLYGATGFLLGLFLIARFDDYHEVLALAIAGIACAGLFLVLRPGPMAWVSVALFLWAGFIWSLEGQVTSDAFEAGQGAFSWWRLLAGTLVALSLGSDRYFNAFSQSRPMNASSQLLTRNPLLTTLRNQLGSPVLNILLVAHACGIAHLFFAKEPTVSPQWEYSAHALVGFAFFAYGLRFRSWTALALSILTLLVGSWAVLSVGVNFYFDKLTPLAMAFLLPAIFWMLCERCNSFFSQKKEEKPQALLTGTLVAMSSLLLVRLLQFFPDQAGLTRVWVTLGWFALGVGLILLSIAFREKHYRYGGLVIILLSLGRVFLVDLSNTAPAWRIAAFAVLGTGLLPIAYGYFKWMERLRQQKNIPKENPS